jgi:hypothetical protein
VNNATCSNSTNGSASVNVSGGTSPYSYAWSPAVSTTNSASGLAVGAYSVVVTDNKGCESTVSFSVEASDVELPTWSTATGSIDAVVVCGDAAALAAAQDLVPTANDANTLTYTKVPGAFVASENCPTLGTYTNRFIARDLCLNASDEFVQVITVIDTILPYFTSVPSDITIQCGEEVPSTLAEAEDGCSLALVTKNDSEVGSDCERVITRTFTATDACGNKAYSTQIITIVDTINPYFTSVPADVTLQCGDALPTTMAEAADACYSAEVTMSDSESGTECNRIISRTFRATDICGNYLEAVQTITIVDTIQPYFTSVPSDVTLQCGDVLPTTMAEAADACYSAEVTMSDSESGTDCNRIITRTFRATDVCGNYLEAVQTITIVDTIQPYFTSVPADVTLQCGDALPTTMAEAADACYTAEVTMSDSESGTECNRIITRTFRATDVCGNYLEAVQTITIVDTIQPYFTFVPADINSQCGIEVPFVNAQAADNCSQVADVTYQDSEVGEGCNRVITRTFTATDACGNELSVVQIISIIDTIRPTIYNVPVGITVSCVSEIPSVLTEVYADDNCVGVELSYEESNTGDVCESTITRTWKAMDACGNSSEASQVIIVKDTTAPQFTSVPSGTTVACEGDIDFVEPIAIDNCEGLVSYSFTDSIIAGVSTSSTTTDCGQFTTYTAGGWGSPSNSTPGSYLNANFETAFPNGLVVGCDEAAYTFTSAQAIRNFLPAGGPSSVLSADAINPTGVHNQLANQLVAASLNFGFDAASANFGSAAGSLGDLIYNNGPFAGQTVNQVMAQANQVLGGCASGNLQNLASALALLNENYDNGNQNDGGFSCGGGNNNNQCEYTISRRWKATDRCNNASTVVVNYIVKDTIAPTFNNCPESVSAICINDLPAVAEGITATDNCGASATVAYLGEQVVAIDECSYTVTRTWSATDACGNRALCQQVINVADDVKPTFTSVPSDITIACTDEVPASNATATDNCSTVVVTQSDDVIVNGCVTTVVRTFTATDACGNEKTAEQRIIKRDEVNPVLGQFPAYIHVACDSLDYVTSPTASDNCGEVTVTFVDLLNSGGCFGTIQRTYTAQDACGNTATGTQFISLYDHQGPAINVPDSVVFECNEAVIIPAFEAVDNCGEVIEFTHTIDSIPGTCVNNYTIVYHFTAVDFCENVSHKDMVIVVRDTTAPSWVSTPADATVLCSEEVPAVVMPTASDLCDNDVEVSVTVSEEAGACANERTIIRSFRASDDCGNSIMFEQHIYLVDTIAPVFGEQESFFTFSCGQDVPFVQPTATDACGDVTYSHVDGPWMEDACLGYFERTWTAEDACGNTSSFVQTINKVDTELPTITGAAALDKLCSDYEGIFVSASDNCDQEVNITYEDTHVSGGCAGRILRTYVATDDCGNASEFIQIITLIDTIRPHAIGSVENRTVECGSEWAFGSIEFGDNCDDELDITIEIDTTGTACDKVYTKRWTAVDNCNNTTTVTEEVHVVDTLDPYYTFVPADTTIECGAEIVRLNATAYDQCAGDITVDVIEMENPGSCPSNYQIMRIFRASDNCGNSAMAVQYINIVDTQAPTWNVESAPAQLSFECGQTPEGIQPTAEDGCSTYTVSVQDTVYVTSTCYTSGAFIYIATDACGNASAPFYQYYSIEDTTAPVVTEFSPAIERPCSDFEGNFITATDACSAVIITYEDQLMSGTCLGHIVRTYNIVDSCGNVVDGLYQQIITLTDNERPVPVAMPENINLECGTFETIPSFIPEFTDNCDPDGLDVSADTVRTDLACGYEIRYSWTATDNCGNDTTIYQTVTVRDTQNPYFTFVPGTINVGCDEVIEYNMPAAADLCDMDVTITESVDTIAGNCRGTYTIVRHFTATDDCNYTASAEQIINVMDEDAPNFTFVPADGTYSCEQGIPADAATAEDVCGTATITYSDETVSTCANTYRVTRTWYATDDCNNTREAVTIYNVVDTIAPTLDVELPLNPIRVTCLGDVPAPIAATATDNCGLAFVNSEVRTIESDSCGNGTILVMYTLTDECGNEAYASYQIVIEDNVDPEFTTSVSDIVLNCNQSIPAPASMEATDNCGNPVRIMFEEYTTGGAEMPEGAVSACQLITPAIAQATGCQSYYQNKNWALWLGSLSSAHRYFQVSSGNLYTMADGSLLLQANMVNTSNPSYGGFTVNVKFANGLDWAAWSNQAFPTSYKADCGGVGANHTSWVYYLLQNTPGAELVGYGAYQGSALDLSHAPANKYFGFQLGNGANNLTPGEGLGGWFNFSGTMVFTAPGGSSTTTLLTPNTVSAGDFAFNLDCCPRTVTHRCWTAIDCSQNSTTVCQVIRYVGTGNAVGNLHDNPSQIASEVAGDKVVVEVSPNPAVDMTQFSFQAIESGKASLVIYNMAGAVVARVPEMKVEAGVKYKVPYAVNHLAAGLYTIQLNNENSSDITRLMISGK